MGIEIDWDFAFALGSDPVVRSEVLLEALEEEGIPMTLEEF